MHGPMIGSEYKYKDSLCLVLKANLPNNRILIAIYKTNEVKEVLSSELKNKYSPMIYINYDKHMKTEKHLEYRRKIDDLIMEQTGHRIWHFIAKGINEDLIVDQIDDDYRVNTPEDIVESLLYDYFYNLEQYGVEHENN